jgi:protein RecA
MAKSAPLTKEDRLKALEQTLKGLGCTTTQIKHGGDLDNIDYLPTGQIEVDSILGDGGGVPRGTVLELAGESQSGKSYLGYKIMAEANRRGEWAVYFNIENSFYPPRAASLGVKIDDSKLFTLVQYLETAEQYGEVVYAMVDSGLYSVIVLDSISAMVPDADYDKPLEDNPKIGAHAMFMKRFTRKLLNKCAQSGTIVVMINQLYMGAGAMPGTMVPTATGGNAMNFMPHMRLWFKKINGAKGKVVDAEAKVIGGKSKVTLVKTRYSEPWIETEFPIMFGDSESDPIAEFFFRAKAKGYEYIKEVRKVYKYTISETGEVVDSKNPAEMITLLFEAPAPEIRTRGDNSTNALEYICGKLKMTSAQMNILIESANRSLSSYDNEQSEESGED